MPRFGWGRRRIRWHGERLLPADGPLLRRMASTTVFFSEYMIPTAGP